MIKHLPLYQDVPSQTQKLGPNQDLKQQAHFSHVYRTAYQVSQPILMKKATVPHLLAHSSL
ncbi:hypothetical protein HanIR_Chr12g0608511 [Helianthus annuus]|nr:hypothetical protein HanIR_Chr12g0608511 [Helianthus annuus]